MVFCYRTGGCIAAPNLSCSYPMLTMLILCYVDVTNVQVMVYVVLNPSILDAEVCTVKTVLEG